MDTENGSLLEVIQAIKVRVAKFENTLELGSENKQYASLARHHLCLAYHNIDKITG